MRSAYRSGEGVTSLSDDISDIVFHNLPLFIEGTLRKQDYRVRQVEYQLARLRRARGEITAEDLEGTRAAYAATTASFQRFWDTKGPTD
jgi:hypothetical protein